MFTSAEGAAYWVAGLWLVGWLVVAAAALVVVRTRRGRLKVLAVVVLVPALVVLSAEFDRQARAEREAGSVLAAVWSTLGVQAGDDEPFSTVIDPCSDGWGYLAYENRAVPRPPSAAELEPLGVKLRADGWEVRTTPDGIVASRKLLELKVKRSKPDSNYPDVSRPYLQAAVTKRCR